MNDDDEWCDDDEYVVVDVCGDDVMVVMWVGDVGG